MSFHRVTGLVAALYIETSPRMLGAAQTSTRWRTPMTGFATRTLLSIGLLVGLGTGCVHRHDTNPPAAPPSSLVTADDIARQPGQPLGLVPPAMRSVTPPPGPPRPPAQCRTKKTERGPPDGRSSSY